MKIYKIPDSWGGEQRMSDENPSSNIHILYPFIHLFLNVCPKRSILKLLAFDMDVS